MKATNNQKQNQPNTNTHSLTTTAILIVEKNGGNPKEKDTPKTVSIHRWDWKKKSNNKKTNKIYYPMSVCVCVRLCGTERKTQRANGKFWG